jgi:hypothetical protein
MIMSTSTVNPVSVVQGVKRPSSYSKADVSSDFKVCKPENLQCLSPRWTLAVQKTPDQDNPVGNDGPRPHTRSNHASEITVDTPPVWHALLPSIHTLKLDFTTPKPLSPAGHVTTTLQCCREQTHFQTCWVLFHPYQLIQTPPQNAGVQTSSDLTTMFRDLHRFQHNNLAKAQRSMMGFRPHTSSCQRANKKHDPSCHTSTHQFPRGNPALHPSQTITTPRHRPADVYPRPSSATQNPFLLSTLILL